MSLDGLGGDFIIGSNARRQAAVQFGKTFASGLGVAAAVNWNETNGADLYYREFDSPETNHGVAQALDFDNFRAAMATLTYGPLKVWGRAHTHQKGIPTGSYDTRFNEFSETQVWSADVRRRLCKESGFRQATRRADLLAAADLLGCLSV